jgi:serine/threonine protein kinase/tetratricopeptide (TPR) repeat protein
MPSDPVKPANQIRFGDDYELDLRAYELRRAGRVLKLERIPMELLILLVSNRGQLVSRDQIIEGIWGKDVFLDTDNSINAAIRKIRQVLKDNPEQPRFVQTITGRGYRFIAPVVEVAPPIVEPAALEEPSPTAENLAGKKVSHYRILHLLGGGGMGVVYKAEDLKLGRKVAVKFLPAEMAGDAKAFERLEREARAASALEHPNICPIYELGEHEGQPFIVMQLLEGQTLQEKIESANQQKQPLPTNDVLDLAQQIVAGLEAAHAKNIIHRDIKPANIFITDHGEVKILDFGLAKIVEQDDSTKPIWKQAGLTESLASSAPAKAFSTLRLTRTGTTVGTVHYMSPEQVRGETLDAGTDVFSFGLVLYEMATGRRTFPGDTVAVVQDAILHQTPLPIQHLNPELPAGLDRIITKALEKDRGLRYRSAADLRADFKRLKREVESGQSFATDSGQAVVTEASATGQGKRRRIALFVLTITLLGAGTLSYRSRHQPKHLSEQDTIVLADFANSTGDPVFDDALKTALSVSLRQSPFLNMLSDSEVERTLQLMTRPAGTRLTPEVARELCQRAGSRAYIAGSIGSLGTEYVLELKAVNCQSGDTLAQEQVTATSKEKVLDVLGEATSALRSELGESLATVQKFDVPLQQATTPSLEALKALSLGRKASNEKGDDVALLHHQRAIELDPNFAMAYAAVGADYSNLGQLERAHEYYGKAFELRERSSERERLAITADFYLNVTGELEKAAQTYQEEIESYPRSWVAYGNLGVVFALEGQYEKAAQATRQLLRLAPDQISSYVNLADYALALQRFDEASQIIHEETPKLDDFAFHNALYALAFLAENSPALAEQQQWFARKPESEAYGLALASDTEAYAGHLGKARELTRRAVDSAIAADNKEAGALWEDTAALREAAYGNPGEARRLTAEALKLAPASQGAKSEAALAFAMAGDRARAESLLQDLGRRFPLDTQMQSLWLPAIRTQLALDSKNPASALDSPRAASPLELGQIVFVSNLSCLYPVYLRGEAYLAAGQGSAAATEFQKILDHNGIVWNCWTGALAHLGVARANALEARSSQAADADRARGRALEAYKDFFKLWRDADPGILILQQAKAEYAKLQSPH